MRTVPPCDLLLEFVEQDDVQALARDARTLRDLVAQRALAPLRTLHPVLPSRSGPSTQEVI